MLFTITNTVRNRALGYLITSVSPLQEGIAASSELWLITWTKKKVNWRTRALFRWPIKVHCGVPAGSSFTTVLTNWFALQFVSIVTAAESRVIIRSTARSYRARLSLSTHRDDAPTQQSTQHILLVMWKNCAYLVLHTTPPFSRYCCVYKCLLR